MYFNRDHAAERASSRQAERARLITKAKRLGNTAGKDDGAPTAGARQLFGRVWEAMEGLGVLHCMDCNRKEMER